MNKQPLITDSFIKRVSLGIAILLGLTILIYIVGRTYGERMLLDGHTDDQMRLQIIIGDEILSIKANQIRFANQRKEGQTDGISLYVSWPEFEGYQQSNKQKFNQSGATSQLVFINLGQSDGTADMSARYNPIYQNFIHGTPEDGPSGLLRYQMQPQSNFKDEILYAEKIIKERPFVILCYDRRAKDIPNAANCQRDIQLDRNLTITYRYAQEMLKDWQQIEEATLSYLSTIRNQVSK